MKDKGALKRKVRADERLTAFQKKVLLAALEIPKGQVRTYAWIARKAGAPKAFRAAGQALGKNPYAPHIPCHRVIASDGSLGGYAGGLKRKRKLLRQEGVRFPAPGSRFTDNGIGVYGAISRHTLPS